MPISPEFEARLHPVLAQAAEEFGTPFHIYDEQGVHDTCTAFDAAFAHLDFQEFYAVKALPNPTVLALLAGHSFGFDCSSLPELALAAQAGARGHQICFTSNNTSRAELAAALELGAIVNIDDEAVLDKLPSVPDTLFFRLNPGQVRGEDDFLGSPQDAKFGVPTDRLVPVVAKAKALGVRDFGLHMMLASNSLTPAPTLLTLDLLLEQALRLREELGVEVSAVNLGGGIGIPYRPDERPFDLPALGEAIARRLARWEHEHRATRPRVCFESGRYVTGPHGALVTRVLNRMDKWRAYAGVDASMSSLMRPALYPSAYHHITAPFADRTHMETVDVVGSLCENNDRFGKDRTLPRLTEGELLVIHDTGAHGHAMGFTYNGRLRPQELLLRTDGSVELIRRAEEERDHFATLDFKPKRLVPRGTSGAGE